MSTIWIDKHSRLKRYSATVSSSKSLVTIVIECSEPGSLGYLLEGLRDIEAEQKKAAAEQRKPRKSAVTADEPLALPAPPLRLSYSGDAS